MLENTAKADVIAIEHYDDIAVLTFNRPDKRNAMNDDLVEALDRFFSNRPSETRAAWIWPNTGTANRKKPSIIRAIGTACRR